MEIPGPIDIAVARVWLTWLLFWPALSEAASMTGADAAELKRDARAVIGRVYDPRHAERRLGFRCETDFAAILAALRDGRDMPFAHDADYISPQVAAASI
jgi:hypothetical protein